MKATKIKDLKNGEFFCMKEYDDSVNEVPERLVWIRGEYDRASKKYSCVRWNNANAESFFKGDKVVYTEIYF